MTTIKFKESKYLSTTPTDTYTNTSLAVLKNERYIVYITNRDFELHIIDAVFPGGIVAVDIPESSFDIIVDDPPLTDNYPKYVGEFINN